MCMQAFKWKQSNRLLARRDWESPQFEPHTNRPEPQIWTNTSLIFKTEQHKALVILLLFVPIFLFSDFYMMSTSIIICGFVVI